MKELIIVFLISVIGIAAVSAIAGWAAWLFGFSFWGWFGITSVMSSIIGYLWNVYLEKKMGVERLLLETENNLATAYQNVEVVCQYCSTKNIIRLALNKDNTFKCVNCNGINRAIVSIVTARTTEPIIADEGLKKIFTQIKELPDTSSKQPAINTEKIEITK